MGASDFGTVLGIWNYYIGNDSSTYSKIQARPRNLAFAPRSVPGALTFSMAEIVHLSEQLQLSKFSGPNTDPKQYVGFLSYHRRTPTDPGFVETARRQRFSRMATWQMS